MIQLRHLGCALMKPQAHPNCREAQGVSMVRRAIVAKRAVFVSPDKALTESRRTVRQG